MKVLLTLFVLLAGTFCWGQETKKQIYENDSPPFKETYYVLKDNPEVKHGQYKRSYRRFTATGYFDNGKKVGVWEFTGSDGQVEQRIDFTNGTVTNLKPAEFAEGYWIKEGGNYKEIEPDEPPVFIGGRGWFNYYSWTTLRYPAEARRRGVQGKVLISATITKDGTMIDEKVEEGPGYGTNEEALRVIQLIQDDWIPTKLNGEVAEIRVLIPVMFKLAE